MTTKHATARERAGARHAPPNPRLTTLATLVRSVGVDESPGSEDFGALADLLLDAILGSDRTVLDEAVTQLRAVEVAHRRGSRRPGLDARLARIETLLALATGARDRVPAREDLELVAPGTRAHAVLELIHEHRSLRGKDIRGHLKLDAGHLSRITTDLTRRRLVAPVKAGRDVFFDITPHGEDVLDDVASRRLKERRRQKALAVPQSMTPVLYADSGDAFELQTEAVRAALEQSGDPAGRSRALFVTLAATRPAVITDRLLVWDSLTRATLPERVEIRLPGPEKPEEAIQRLTWEVLDSAGIPTGKARAMWPGPAPLWDGWAVVRGRRGKDAIVFLEAKSQTQELKTAPLRVGRSHDRSAWAGILGNTAEYLGAEHRWDAWPDYADAALRLAFVHLLQRVGVPVWWFNLYFVDPKRLMSRLPATRGVWDAHIKDVRAQLSITEGHALSKYIAHEVAPVPEEGILLGEPVG